VGNVSVCKAKVGWDVEKGIKDRLSVCLINYNRTFKPKKGFKSLKPFPESI
jgi:hypothetical protein